MTDDEASSCGAEDPSVASCSVVDDDDTYAEPPGSRGGATAEAEGDDADSHRPYFRSDDSYLRPHRYHPDDGESVASRSLESGRYHRSHRRARHRRSSSSHSHSSDGSYGEASPWLVGIVRPLNALFDGVHLKTLVYCIVGTTLLLKHTSPAPPFHMDTETSTLVTRDLASLKPRGVRGASMPEEAGDANEGAKEGVLMEEDASSFLETIGVAKESERGDGPKPATEEKSVQEDYVVHPEDQRHGAIVRQEESPQPTQHEQSPGQSNVQQPQSLVEPQQTQPIQQQQSPDRSDMRPMQPQSLSLLGPQQDQHQSQQQVEGLSPTHLPQQQPLTQYEQPPSGNDLAQKVQQLQRLEMQLANQAREKDGTTTNLTHGAAMQQQQLQPLPRQAYDTAQAQRTLGQQTHSVLQLASQQGYDGTQHPQERQPAPPPFQTNGGASNSGLDARTQSASVSSFQVNSDVRPATSYQGFGQTFAHDA